MKTTLNLITLFSFVLLFSCTTETPEEPVIVEKPVKRENVGGFVQKGPFAIGTSVTVSELDSLLSQTGRNFNTQITTNDGNFHINNIVLNNNLVEIKADGFYYNEVKGVVSENRLTLYSLSDLTDQSTVNVNVLSYLEKARIECLVASGKSFKEAKKQAQKEVLKIFEIEKDNIPNSEQLDLSKDGEDNAILLATSVILQGRRSVAELSELLAKISLDIRTDGVLNDTLLGSDLINHAKILRLNSVRSNIEYKYSSMGKNDTIPDFEQFVNNFVERTNFKYTFKVEYPRSGKYGLNVLSINDGEMITAPKDYSIRALLPELHDLRVRFTKTSDSDPVSWYYFTLMEGAVSTFEIKNITTSIYDLITKEEVKDADQKITYEGSGTGKIEVFENNTVAPSRTINYSWGPPQYYGIGYQNSGKYGKNIFRMPDNSILTSGQTYSLELTMPTNVNLNLWLWIVRISGTGTMTFDKSKVINWDAELAENKDGLHAYCSNPGMHVDMPVIFTGAGECTLELRAGNSSNPVIMFRHFKWE